MSRSVPGCLILSVAVLLFGGPVEADTPRERILEAWSKRFPGEAATSVPVTYDLSSSLSGDRGRAIGGTARLLSGGRAVYRLRERSRVLVVHRRGQRMALRVGKAEVRLASGPDDAALGAFVPLVSLLDPLLRSNWRRVRALGRSRVGGVACRGYRIEFALPELRGLLKRLGLSGEPVARAGKRATVLRATVLLARDGGALQQVALLFQVAVPRTPRATPGAGRSKGAWSWEQYAGSGPGAGPSGLSVAGARAASAGGRSRVRFREFALRATFGAPAQAPVDVPRAVREQLGW